jgi:hypothetical protein
VPEVGLERVSQCNLPESGNHAAKNTVILIGGLTGTTRALVAGDAYRATRPPRQPVLAVPSSEGAV